MKIRNEREKRKVNEAGTGPVLISIGSRRKER
jgi:hypothetical protein